MSAADALAGELLTSLRFTTELAKAAGRQVGRELLGAEPDGPAPNWSYLLSCASVMALAEEQQALDAALRIMESTLTATDSTTAHKAAAQLLLDRVGNHLAIDVAQRKHNVHVAEIGEYPAPLRLDVVRSRLELALPTADGAPMRVSRFQRNMWTALNQVTWVSASAPTSAGKSRVIRMWFKDVLERAAQQADVSVRLAVVVPTRALVDEVSAELRVALPFGVQVTSLPWDGRATQAPAEVFVMTQERLHLLQQRFGSLTFDVLFVDEAHKLGDGSRGVLLQQVIDESVRRHPGTQVIFASPLAEDPEVLLDGAPAEASTRTVDSQAATVTQNLLYANQVRGNRRRWELELLLGEAPMRLGHLEIPTAPPRDSDRLPLVAVTLARGGGGNVVYANTAAEAEKIAASIADALDSDVSDDPDVDALVELVEKTISPRYKLAEVLRRGVAFHYGNMPQIVRAEVERLFREDKLRFLVCTSTLLEGVNLPCRNLFVRGPKRGNNNPMTASDFWNLAGRAGRWGMELEGNIVCVDTSQPGRWAVVPGRRKRQRIKRETAAAFRDARALAGWINEGARADRTPPSGEAVYSFLASRVAAGVSLTEVPGLGAGPEDLAQVQEVITRSLETIEFPCSLISRHAGINPLSMQRLLQAMRSTRDPSMLVIDPANRYDAWKSYQRAFAMLVDVMGADFGEEKRRNQLAVMVVSWMTGKPLSHLIANRLKFEASKPADKRKTTAAAIRDVMSDVESVARFRAPKFLACYLDLAKFHFASIGRHDLVDSAPQGLEMQLELGVFSGTQLSLMSLGLSRTSAIELHAKIDGDDLDPQAVLGWIVTHRGEVSTLPALVTKEIDALLTRERLAEGA